MAEESKQIDPGEIGPRNISKKRYDEGWFANATSDETPDEYKKRLHEMMPYEGETIEQFTKRVQEAQRGKPEIDQIREEEVHAVNVLRLVKPIGILGKYIEELDQERIDNLDIFPTKRRSEIQSWLKSLTDEKRTQLVKELEFDQRRDPLGQIDELYWIGTGDWHNPNANIKNLVIHHQCCTKIAL